MFLYLMIYKKKVTPASEDNKVEVNVQYKTPDSLLNLIDNY